MYTIALIILSILLPVLLARKSLAVWQRIMLRLQLQLQRDVQSELLHDLLMRMQVTTDVQLQSHHKVVSYILPRIPRFISEGVISEQEADDFLRYTATLQVMAHEPLLAITQRFVKEHTEVRKNYRRPEDYDAQQEHALFRTYYRDVHMLWKEQTHAIL